MNKVTVHIFGKEYVLMSERSKEFIIRVASYVDDEINEVASKLQNPVKDDIFILACNNIAERLLSSDSPDLIAKSEQLEQTIEKLKRENVSLTLEMEQKDVKIKSLEMEDKSPSYDKEKLEREKEKHEKEVKKLTSEVDKYRKLNDEIQGKFYDLQMKLAKSEEKLKGSAKVDAREDKNED